MNENESIAPGSIGPTHSSPYGTACTNGSLPELNLPPSFEKQKASSTDLIVFRTADGVPSPVRNHDVVDASAKDGDSEADAEEWLAEEDGGFSPKKAPMWGFRVCAWKPASLLCIAGAPLPALRVGRRPHLLLLIAVLLGPNLGFLAYLTGVAGPSGSAHPQADAPPPHQPPDAAAAGASAGGGHVPFSFSFRVSLLLPTTHAKDDRAHARGPAPTAAPRQPEARGEGLWLLPAALWKRGVLLIPAFVGWG